MEWYLKVIMNYAVFRGRARRKEYWMFALFNLIASICLGFIMGIIIGILGVPHFLSQTYTLLVLIPAFAVGVRRMHDTNHSGWWLICPFYNIVLLCTDGDPAPNRFGSDPKST